MIISRQITRRIRLQQRELSTTVDRLEAAAEKLGDEQFVTKAQELEGALRDHIGLVDAVLDAVSEDDVPQSDRN